MNTTKAKKKTKPELEKITPGKVGYSSVTDYLREKFPPEFADSVQELLDNSVITRELVRLRIEAGLTQAEMGKAIGCTQSRISKLESGSDDDLTLKDIREYAKTLKIPLRIEVDPEPMQLRVTGGLKIVGKELITLSDFQETVENRISHVVWELFSEVMASVASGNVSFDKMEALTLSRRHLEGKAPSRRVSDEPSQVSQRRQLTATT